MFNTELILKAFENCIFDQLCCDNYSHNILDQLDPAFLDNYFYDDGATKLVFISKEDDFVIKIPFTGEYEFGAWGEDGFYQDEFYEFTGAKEPNGWDYCLVEVLEFQLALEGGLDKFFLETYPIGYVHGHPIYAQRKATMFNRQESAKRYSHEYIKSLYKQCDSEHVACFNEYWIADFVSCYGMETFMKLAHHLDNNNICDLHGGNLGYVDGCPVIVDYAGYWD